MAWGAFSSVGAMGGGWTPQGRQTWWLASSISEYTWPGDYSGPEHAVELVLSNKQMGWGWGGQGAQPFCQPGTQTTPKDILVADGTLESFMAMTRSEQLGAAKAVLDALPDGIVAHRLGEFVFTYHGAMLGGNDPELWVVVMIPDPDVNGAPQPGDLVVIGTDVWAVVREITFAELAAELEEQNEYRAELELPPLPDLSTVTHDEPASSSSGEESEE